MSLSMKSQRREREVESRRVLHNSRNDPAARALLQLLTDRQLSVQEKLTIEDDPRELARLQGEHRGLAWVLKCLIDEISPKD
jgi:hypothetical protein